jgi:hypothetical protein
LQFRSTISLFNSLRLTLWYRPDADRCEPAPGV